MFNSSSAQHLDDVFTAVSVRHGHVVLHGGDVAPAVVVDQAQAQAFRSLASSGLVDQIDGLLGLPVEHARSA